MNSFISFDTLRFTKRLEQGGFTTEQAQTEAEALAEVLQFASMELATKRDVEDVRREVGDLRKEMNARFESLEQRFNARFDSAEQSNNARFESLEQRFNARFEKLELALTVKLGVMLAACAGIIIAALRVAH